MGKLAGALIGVAAFVVALYLVLARRPLPSGRRGGRLGARFAVLVTACVWLLTGCRAAPEQRQGPSTSPGARQAGPGGKTPAAPKSALHARLEARAEWRAFRKDWLGVGQLTVTGHASLKPTIEQSKQTNAKRLAALVAAGLMSKQASQVLCDVLGDRIYHRLRPMTASCYDPTSLGLHVQLTRDDLEKRLALLATHARAGRLRPAVVRKVTRHIAKQLELLLRVEAHWKKSWRKDRDAYLKQEQQLEAFIVRGASHAISVKDTITVRKGIPEAIRLLELLYRKP